MSKTKNIKHFIYTRRNLLVLLFFLLAFFVKGYVTLDPDFGWHIRLGQIIRETGIPQYDPFSYTMAHYPVIAHEWLTDILLSILLPQIGRIGLAMVFALCGVSALVLVINLISKKNKQWAFIPVALTAITLFDFVGIRPQVVTWLLLSLLLNLLFRNSSKYLWILVPLLFILWVNIHGGFALGIAVVILYSIAKMIESREVSFKYLTLIFLSISATIINPYGLRIWHEIWTTMSDSSLRWVIAEWLPAYYLPNFLYWVYFALSTIIITRYIKKFLLTELVVFFFLALISLSGMRHIPLFALMALPLTTKSLGYLADEAVNIKYGTMRFKKLYKYLAILNLGFFVPTFLIGLLRMQTMSTSAYYPVSALEYLNKKIKPNKLFTIYGWGGYVVWKQPGSRVNIHGMMPSWRDHKFPGESENSFRDYTLIVKGEKSLLKSVNDFKVDTILIPAGGSNEVEDSPEWEIVYKDNLSEIYKRK